MRNGLIILVISQCLFLALSLAAEKDVSEDNQFHGLL